MGGATHYEHTNFSRANFGWLSAANTQVVTATGDYTIAPIEVQSSTAVSFLSEAGMQDGYNFLTPPGLDMSAVVAHGDAVLFAWAGDYSPVKPMYQFSPRRSHRHTLWRVAADVY